MIPPPIDREPVLDALDRDALRAACRAHLERAAGWAPKKSEPGIVVSSGMLEGPPCRAYRTELHVDASPERVVRFIADDMFEELPGWNREFVDGEILRVIDESDDRKAWLMRVFYATPAPLANREYLYLLERHREPEGAVLISYQSVDHPAPLRDGYVRGLLEQTVHRVSRRADGTTRLEHVLSGDIRGRFSPWIQSHLLAGGFVAANLRDARAQQRLLDGAADAAAQPTASPA